MHVLRTFAVVAVLLVFLTGGLVPALLLIGVGVFLLVRWLAA
jgi:hypothetical protein